MASFFPASLENLIDGFASLPGIGRKSAQRLAFHILSLPAGEAERFANAVLEAREKVHTCPVCQNLTEEELCPICSSDRRDKSVVCVVSEPRDVLSIERSREYNGLYHVLHGALSPMNRIGPEDLRIRCHLVLRYNRHNRFNGSTVFPIGLLQGLSLYNDSGDLVTGRQVRYGKRFHLME